MAVKPSATAIRLIAGVAVAVLGHISFAAAEPLRVLMLGDSLTAGYGLKPAAALPAQLERYLKERALEVEILDGGVSGDTTAGGRARLDWALAERPTAVIVALGGNDGLRGLAPEATEANLDAILTRLKSRGLRVMLAGMRVPPNLGATYADAFDAIFPRLARKHDVVLYPFLLEGVAAVPDLNQSDGIHPNAAGVTAIVERLGPAVERWLGSR